MNYVSTRGGSERLTFSETILRGQAADGGLFVPAAIPYLPPSMLARGIGRYDQMAYAILRAFAPDIPPTILRSMVEEVYTKEHFSNVVDDVDPHDVVPVTTIDGNVHLVRLSNGPTLSFNDIALQLMGRLFEYVLDGRPLTILGATSGDTGAAAIHAMLHRKHIRVCMLSPRDTMSPFQRAQLWSVVDPRVVNIAVNGSFDDCQRMMNTIFDDTRFAHEHALGSVHATNWVQIVAQIVYYYWAYWRIRGSSTEPIDITIPAGNFGNVCAAFMAKLMGVPMRHFGVVTNANDVLDVAFHTGLYRPRRITKTTLSPALDIASAVNFERFLYYLFGQNAARVQSMYNELTRSGFFSFSHDRDRITNLRIRSTSVSDNLCRAAIRTCFDTNGVIIDPHTATALAAVLVWNDTAVPMVVLETAQPCKFDATIRDVLGSSAPRPSAFDGIEDLPQQFLEVDAGDVDAVKRIITAHS